MERIELGERPSRGEDLVAWYRAALELQADSGLSMPEFASRAGVSAWTLYDWRRRLAAPSVGDASPRLVEVEVVPSAPSGGMHLTVFLHSDHRIEVPADLDVSGLRRLIGALESC